MLAVDGYEVRCEFATYHGSSSVATATTQTIVPTYTGCTAFGLNAEIRGFGHYGGAISCYYMIRADNKADLDCTSGDVTIRAGSGLCIAHVPAQWGLGTITYTTGTRWSVKHDLTLDVNLTGITANLTDAGGFFCPFSGDTHVTNGTLTGKATVWAQDPTTGAAVDLTWDATVA